MKRSFEKIPRMRKISARWSVMISLLAIFSLVFINLNAAWLDDLPTNIKQPDGTRIEALMTGDEFYSWVHDEKFW